MVSVHGDESEFAGQRHKPAALGVQGRSPFLQPSGWEHVPAAPTFGVHVGKHTAIGQTDSSAGAGRGVDAAPGVTSVLVGRRVGPPGGRRAGLSSIATPGLGGP